MQIGHFCENTPDFVCGTYTVANLLENCEVREFNQLTGKGEARPTNDRAVKKLAKIILAGEFLPTPILVASDGSGGKLPIVLGATRFMALKYLLESNQIKPNAEIPVVIYYGADPKEASLKAHYASGDFPSSDLKAMESAVGIGVSGAESELHEVARSIAEALNNDDTSLLKRQFRADKNSAMMEVSDLTGGDLRTSLIGTAKLLKFFNHKGIKSATDAINHTLFIANYLYWPHMPPNHDVAAIRHVLGVANQILFRGAEFTDKMIIASIEAYRPPVEQPKNNRIKKKEEDVTPKQYEDAYQGFEPEEDEVVTAESASSFVESAKAAVSQERGPGVVLDEVAQMSEQDMEDVLAFMSEDRIEKLRSLFNTNPCDGPAKYLYGETYEDVVWSEPPPAEPLASEEIVAAIERAAPSPAKPKSKKLKKLPPEAFVTPAIPFFTENHSPEITVETTVDTIEIKPPPAIIKVDEPPKELILDPNQHPAVLAHKRAWRRPTEKRQLIADGFAPSGAVPDGERFFEFGGFVWDKQLFEERCEWIGYHLLTQGKPPYRPAPIDTTWEDDEDIAQLAKYRDRVSDQNAWLNNMDANESFEIGNFAGWMVPEKKRQSLINAGGEWWR